MSFAKTSRWLACMAYACLIAVHGDQSAIAQTDCGCSQSVATKGYSLNHNGASPCESGCGTGSAFFGRLRNAFRCEPQMREGLWDGYCEERGVCDTGHGHRGGRFLSGRMGGCNQGCDVAPASDHGTAADCGNGCGDGYGIFANHRNSRNCGLRKACGRRQGSRLFNFPQAAGCGSSAHGLPCGDCETAVAPVAVAATGNCNSGCGGYGCDNIFGTTRGCFRNDGHFFGCLSRHGHRIGGLHQRNGCGCNLFSGPGNRFKLGSFGCGHCQNGQATQSYSVDCGSDAVATPHAAPVVPVPVDVESN